MTRRRGRPALDPNDRQVPLTIRVSSKQFDALCHKAHELRVSVPELVRRQLAEKGMPSRE
jgi:hypothetical protein